MFENKVFFICIIEWHENSIIITPPMAPDNWIEWYSAVAFWHIFSERSILLFCHSVHIISHGFPNFFSASKHSEVEEISRTHLYLCVVLWVEVIWQFFFCYFFFRRGQMSCFIAFSVFSVFFNTEIDEKETVIKNVKPIWRKGLILMD